MVSWIGSEAAGVQNGVLVCDTSIASYGLTWGPPFCIFAFSNKKMFKNFMKTSGSPDSLLTFTEYQKNVILFILWLLILARQTPMIGKHCPLWESEVVSFAGNNH